MAMASVSLSRHLRSRVCVCVRRVVTIVLQAAVNAHSTLPLFVLQSHKQIRSCVRVLRCDYRSASSCKYSEAADSWRVRGGAPGLARRSPDLESTGTSEILVPMRYCLSAVDRCHLPNLNAVLILGFKPHLHA
jgi:hypothetical protein